MNSNADYKKILKVIIILFFAFVLVLGIFIYDDYGVSSDEMLQRQHSLINYRYINKVLFQKDIPYISQLTEYNSDNPLPELEDYQYKYYNMAMQIPLVAIEDAWDFSLTSQQILYIRHFYNFLVCFFALICFFFLCRALFKSEVWGLVGTLLLFLFPRFFAESFYNIKDLMFVALYIISIFFMFQMLLKKRKTLWCILFIMFCTLAANTRIVGGMLLITALIVMLAEDFFIFHNKPKQKDTSLITKRENRWWRVLQPYLTVVCGFVLFYYIFTPASWASPVDFIKTVLETFSGFPWNGEMLFAGELITTAQLPWYYIPLWMGLTIPVFYIIMFLTGTGVLITDAIKCGLTRIVECRHIWIVLLVFWVPLIYGIVFKITIYVGWRHVYFLVPPLLIIGVYGIKYLHEKLAAGYKKWGRYIMPSLVCVVFTCLAVWIALAHPYQNVYFNEIGRMYAAGFDRDYWRLANKDMLGYILENYDGKVSILNDNNVELGIQILTPQQQERINIVDSREDADFILNNFRYTPGNEYTMDGFEEIHAIYIDYYKIGTILINRELLV
jgi:hypothetical protein